MVLITLFYYLVFNVYRMKQLTHQCPMLKVRDVGTLTPTRHLLRLALGKALCHSPAIRSRK
jgi:hypothetical protein